MKAKTINNLPTWDEIFVELPEEIKQILIDLKQLRENPIWHPESSCFDHIKIVTNKAREANRYSLMICAIFHDLGKLFTSKINPKTNYPTSPGHEIVSNDYVKKYSNWILNQGVNPEFVKFIVSNHMRAHQIDQMKETKRNMLLSHPWSKDLLEFASYDNMV